jgi:hypothetical protein
VNEPQTDIEERTGELIEQPYITPVTVICASLAQNPLDELAIEINRVVQHIRTSETPKAKGKVTLELSFERRPKIPNALEITADIKVKLPPEPGVTSLLFADDDGRLLTRNPNQRDMFENPRGV